MANPAKPYKEGSGWALRRRLSGQDFFVSGKRTSAAAKKAMDKLVGDHVRGHKPAGLGPLKTTVAQALQDYAVERLPFNKGARQEANRINKYLRAAGLATLTLTKASTVGSEQSCVAGEEPAAAKKGKGLRFVVQLTPPTSQRDMPRCLAKHRHQLAADTADSDRLLEQLARSTVAAVTRHQVQLFMNAYRAAGREPATLQLERAVLRQLFNYAGKVWNWGGLVDNPATGLTLPAVDNGRDRVMSVEEQGRLDAAVHDFRNQLVGPTLTLLTESAMRSSESLERARWRDVQWDSKLLHLSDAKGGKREVPLSPKAIEALQELARVSPGGPDDRIVRMSYEALKAAWIRACKKAGITDLKLHDLRHTAATRMALKTGNVFLVQALTGHKTLSQLTRYVNVKPSDVVAVMHAPEPVAAATVQAPASVPASVDAPVQEPAQTPVPAPQAAAPAAVGARPARMPARWQPRFSKGVVGVRPAG